MRALKPRRDDRTATKGDNGADAPRPALAELPYERQPPGAVPRRWLLAIVLLLLLNVVATTSISWGPAVVEAGRRALANRRAATAKAQADAAQAAAEAAALQREQALQAQAAVFTIPQGTVIYTEDPVEAARLVAESPGYSIIRSDSGIDLPVRAPYPPVMWDGPAELDGLVHGALSLPPHGAPLLLHERRTPGGQPVFVWVALEASRSHSSNTEPDGYFTTVWGDRRLVAWVTKPLPVRNEAWRHTLTIQQHWDRRLRMRVNPDRSAADANVGAVVHEHEILRFLAGRPDPKDATHFEIDYTLDGRPGTIDYWVRDDGRLRVEPREGVKTIKRFDTDGADDWDPRGTAPPKTPAAPTAE